jgi:hypothetical protein
MVARHRWIAFLVLYHLVLVMIFMLPSKGVPTNHWSDILAAFGLPTVQFTWSATVGLILGPSRRVRRWYWMSLLFSPVPLWFVSIITWLAYHFVGIDLACLCLIGGLGIVLLETVAGLFVGIGAHTRSLLT